MLIYRKPNTIIMPIKLVTAMKIIEIFWLIVAKRGENEVKRRAAKVQ